MHYYVDGYNLLFRLGQMEGSLQERRELVIAQLYEKIALLHLNVTLVFDGYYRCGLGSRSHLHFLEICFTDEGETADEWILNELLSSRNPREEIVVTSDKQLAWRARRLHAKTQYVEDFFSLLAKGARKKRKKEEKTPLKPVIKTVPPPHLPSPLEVTDPTFYGYLRIFEENFQKLIEKEPLPVQIEPETDRWLRIFEEKSRENL